MLESQRKNAISGCPLTAALAALAGKWKLLRAISHTVLPLLEQVRLCGSEHSAQALHSH
jgi:hypothetical protein